MPGKGGAGGCWPPGSDQHTIADGMDGYDLQRWNQICLSALYWKKSWFVAPANRACDLVAANITGRWTERMLSHVHVGSLVLGTLCNIALMAGNWLW